MTKQTGQSILPSLLLLCTIISFPELVEPFVTRTYDAENPSESCYDILYDSDENGDGILQNNEYTTFIAELSEGDFDQESYIALSFILKVNFVYLSCMCQFFPGSTDGGCCEGPNGGINVTSANPNNGLDLGGADNVYLNIVCSETQWAIEFAMQEARLSTSPTKTSTTGSPTERPTVEPTPDPSAGPPESPTPLLSADLTESPTDPPSESPFEPPTPSPTTSAPTPSPAPSTAAPTGGPTSSPVTGRPTAGPVTDGPMLAQPTSRPTRVTSIPTMPVTDDPTEQLSAKAPISGTRAPAVSTSTKAPISGTRAPTVTPSTKAHISGTGAPTTTKPIFVQVPTTKAPTPGGTSYLSVSSRPSSIDLSIPPSPNLGEIPEPIPRQTNKPNENPGSVEKPDGDRGTGGDSESKSFTTVQVVGIALAAAFVAYAAAYVHITRQKPKRYDDLEADEVKNQDLDDLEVGNAVEMMGVDDRNKKYGGGSSGPDADGSAGEGFSSGSDVVVYDGELYLYDNPDCTPQSSDGTPRSPSSPHGIALVTGVPTSPQKRAKESDSSSPASESGWSSSAGISSLNTASLEDWTDDGLLPGSPNRLSVIGVADTVTQTANSTQRDAKHSFIPVDDQNDSSTSFESTQGSSDKAMGASPLRIHSKRPQQGKVSREDLNSAIEAGDWAMVGATAALLADSSASDNSLSESEVQSMYRDKGTMCSESMSTRTEELRKKEEVRADVENLVKRLVPDEVENIDKIMLQFEGREKELIQEQNVEQRALAAVQQTAKLEAKAKASIASSSSVTSSGNYHFHLRETSSSSTSSEPSHFSSCNISSISDYTDLATSSVRDLEMNSDDHSSSQSSLGLAIERGDWRAVGEAAVIMAGSSGIIPDSPGDSISSRLSESVGKPPQQAKASREDLNDAIKAGDWVMVGATAALVLGMQGTPLVVADL